MEINLKEVKGNGYMSVVGGGISNVERDVFLWSVVLLLQEV